MKILRQFGCLALLCGLAFAAGDDHPALTIYNQDFATVRQLVVLDLKAGTTLVRFSDATAQVEPDSVILENWNKRPIQVLEQNYRNDPVSQGRMLSLYEGKTIEFLQPDGKSVSGKVVRSGYVPGAEQLQQPIVEVEGKLRFSLPGQPLFPALADDTILRPTFYWLIRTDTPGRGNAELSYITGGLRWEADYNLVAPENGDVLDVVGWITMANNSGKTFENADIKLLAGDVHRIPPPQPEGGYCPTCSVVEVQAAPRVKEKAFDEFHLYTLPLPTTLHDAETKQVEFLRASGVQSKRSYVYDGADIGDDWMYQDSQNDRAYGIKSRAKVGIFREFMNSKANHLGMPLPHGRIRFYRRDEDGRLEFTGENVIDHTPKDERVRIYTGDAFDLVGERKQTDFKTWQREVSDKKGNSETVDNVDESFEIKLRNHKKSAVEIKVVEHMYRASTWKIAESSQPYKKTDARTIEFMVTVPPDGEKTVTYRVHYEW